jgi:hypothetical protein
MVQGMLYEGVKCRHLVLTVLKALHVWFYRHSAELYYGLMRIASVMRDDAVSTAKRCELELGYIVVLQTAGRAGNYNPHLHIIMTDGGLDKEQRWHELINELWRRYPNGLVAHLREETVPKVDGLARYIAKYVVSPPIALSRIVEYDREKRMVKYWYQDHRTGRRQVVEMNRERFIGRMVQHILPKGFKRIRYYGLQATCKAKKVAAVLKRAVKRVVEGVLDLMDKASVKLSYRERMKRAYGKDPIEPQDIAESFPQVVFRYPPPAPPHPPGRNQ